MENPQAKFKPLRGIIILGVFAGIVLASFSVGSYYLLENNIKIGKYSSPEINISGRQRMLAEKIAKLSLSIAVNQDINTRAKLKDELIAAISRMSDSHQALIHGSTQLGLSGAMSPQIEAMYFHPPYDINRKIDSYLNLAKAFAKSNTQAQTINNPNLSKLLSETDDLVAALDAVTQHYVYENKANANAIKSKEITILIAELATLAIMALLVFWPMFRRIRGDIHRIIEVETFSQSIMESMVDGLISINGNGIVRSFNTAAEQIFGYRSNEVVGRNVSMLMPEPYHSEHDGYIERYRSTNEARVIGIGREVEGLHKGGNTFPMYLALNDMRIGEQRYFIGNVRDITKQKQEEKALIEAKEKAELANRAKDSFLATMSHEIRTPLSGMLGMLEVLSLSTLDHDQNKTLQAAWDSGRSLLRIVSDILDWSKIEEGKLSIVPRSTSISDLLQDVVNTYSHIASSKNLKLWKHTDTHLSEAHIVDALRLSQILNNFVSNAIKFTKQGEVEVSAELINRVDSGEKIRFSVKDTGIGIAKDAQQHMFQRYKQESADITRMYGGTGLGLSICRRLVNLMDGQIELESQPGQGSTFSVILTLPVSGTPGEALITLQPHVKQKAVSPLFKNGKDAPLVLVVDDHPINRDLLSRQLKLLGLRVETAEDGEEGLSSWRKRQFVLVITDCHMPGMDGYGLSRAIREDEAKQKLQPHIPIIGWTANAVGDEAELCHAARMDDLLIKPTDLRTLRLTLIKWLSIDASDSPSASRQQESTSGEPIDYAELEKVVPDKADHIQVLSDFQTHIHSDYDMLIDELEGGNQVNVESTAHRMKGSCRMVGAQLMAEVCADVEQAAHNGDMDEAALLTRSALNSALSKFDAYLARTIKND